MFDDEGIFQLRDEHHQALSGCRGRCPSLPLRLGSVVRPSLPRSALGLKRLSETGPQGDVSWDRMATSWDSQQEIQVVKVIFWAGNQW